MGLSNVEPLCKIISIDELIEQLRNQPNTHLTHKLTHERGTIFDWSVQQ
jgi:hypothetical protein